MPQRGRLLSAAWEHVKRSAAAIDVQRRNSMIKINPSAVFRAEFDDSAILFNPDNGEIFSLNPTGRVIWQALTEGADEAAVLKKLAEACRDPLPPEAESDLREFIASLKEKGFVADA